MMFVIGIKLEFLQSLFFLSDKELFPFFHYLAFLDRVYRQSVVFFFLPIHFLLNFNKKINNFNNEHFFSRLLLKHISILELIILKVGSTSSKIYVR